MYYIYFISTINSIFSRINFSNVLLATNSQLFKKTILAIATPVHFKTKLR